jgi:hypothetical protein
MDKRRDTVALLCPGGRGKITVKKKKRKTELEENYQLRAHGKNKYLPS